MKELRTFDDVLVKYGEFGQYQKVVYLLYCIPYIFASTQLMGWVFVGAVPKYDCLSSPSLSIANEEFSNTCTVNGTACETFIYDNSLMSDSVVKEWDLVCGNEELRARVSAAPMLGILIGGIIFGPLSDKWGRKFTFLLSTFIMFLSSILTVFAPEYYSFLVSRILVGLALPGIQTSCYVMGMEIVGPSKRGLSGLLCWYFESFGFLLTLAIAYSYNSNWRILQSIYSLPLIMFIPYIWIAPESPRWLISHKKYSSALQIISKMLDKNKFDTKVESTNIIESLRKSADDDKILTTNFSLCDLFKHPNLRIKTLILNWLWIVTSSLYYVLLLDQSELSQDLFLGFFLTTIVQIPGYLLIMLILDRPCFGRKKSLICMLLLTGSSLILLPFVPEHEPKYHWIKVTLSLIGRFATNCAYTILCIYSSELYPTVIRGIGFSFSFTLSKIGCILGPYILMIGSFWPLVFGVGCVLGGGLTFFLPETLGTQLPDTIEENKQKKSSIWEKGPTAP
nr:organic cation transporter protein-like [Lepeophtheirus salmonis]